MSFALLHIERPPTTNDHLRREFCWSEVRSGLGRILLGYFILVGGYILAGALLAAAIVQVIKASGPQGVALRKLDISILWLFYGGLGLLSVVSLFGYGSIVIGYWRCLINVPERNGARWLLFVSMACVFIGPAINVVAGFTMDKGIELKKGPQGLAGFELTPLARKLQIAGGLTSAASLACFMLFLRAVALCFDDHSRAVHVLVYLFFFGLLIAQSVIVAISRLAPERLLLIAAMLGAGSLILFFWYLYLIGSIRRCIAHGLSQVKNPLEIEPPAAAPSNLNYY